jgi:hypothetical protein
MYFPPFTEEEIKKDKSFSPGIYRFSITESIEKKSSSGNDMFLLFLLIEDESGSSLEIRDYIVSTVRWKLSQLAKSIGEEVISKLKQGSLTAYDLKGKRGTVELVNEATEKGTLLKVKKYIPIEDKSTDKNEVVDDEIPF